MYEITQRNSDGALKIYADVDEAGSMIINTEDITNFLNDLCENEMICEGSKYEELKETNIQLKKKLELSESHIANVMSFRLRREIENLHKRNWYYSVDKIYAEQMLERLSKAISCEEISET